MVEPFYSSWYAPARDEERSEVAEKHAMKYQHDMDLIRDCTCPPADAGPVDLDEAWRYVHEAHDPCASGSFLPVAVKNSKRQLRRPVEEQCENLGLSLYISEAEARAEWRALHGQHPRFASDAGCFLAVGPVSAADGVAEDPDPTTGHFNLYESTSARLHAAFHVVGPLP